MTKTKLRQYARGKPCMVRIPGVCTDDPETTVLAHKNGSGMGAKENDLIAAWACSECHRWLDGGYTNDNRNFLPHRSVARDFRDEFHRLSINRTQQELLKTANKHGQTLAEAIEEWAKGLEL